MLFESLSTSVSSSICTAFLHLHIHYFQMQLLFYFVLFLFCCKVVTLPQIVHFLHSSLRAQWLCTAANMHESSLLFFTYFLLCLSCALHTTSEWVTHDQFPKVRCLLPTLLVQWNNGLYFHWCAVSFVCCFFIFLTFFYQCELLTVILHRETFSNQVKCFATASM